MENLSIIIVCQEGAVVDDPIRYGALEATFAVAKELARSGNRIELYGRASNPEGVVDGLDFRGFRCDSDLLAALHKCAQTDVIIGVSRSDILAHSTAKTYLIYQHGPHFPHGQVPAWMINYLRIPVVCVSLYSIKQQRAMGIHEGNLSLAPNGCDTALFRPESGARLVHGLVFTGGSIEYKGLETALLAFEQILADTPDAKLTVVGPDHIQEDKSGLLRSRGWVDQSGKIQWKLLEQEFPGFRFCGAVSQRTLAGIYSENSMLIAPSSIPETFGLVSIEAQACGCLPVLPRMGGFGETLIEGKTGYLYSPNTADTLAGAICGLWRGGLPDDNQRKQASQWVAETYSWKRASGVITLVAAKPRSARLGEASLRRLAGHWVIWRRSAFYLKWHWRLHALRRFFHSD